MRLQVSCAGDNVTVVVIFFQPGGTLEQIYAESS